MELETREVQGQKTIAVDCDSEFFDDLSEYLDVLGNSQRLKILKTIEREPKDIRQISEETGIAYDNTKKHLYRLLGTGLVKKEAGFGQPTSRGMHPVWKYTLAPNAFSTIIRHLGIFSTVSGAISDPTIARRLRAIQSDLAAKLTGTTTAIVLLAGPCDGMVFALHASFVSIGRVDSDSSVSTSSPGRLVLPSAYSAVTRISHPHAVLVRQGTEWFIEDRGSSSGTTVNGVGIAPNVLANLKNGDVIELGRGPTSLIMTFIALTGETT